MARYAFGRYAYTIRNTIEKLHTRMKPLNKIEFTHDEFLAMFAPPEHWPILKGAAEVADITASGGYHNAKLKHRALSANYANLHFKVDEEGAPLMPRGTDILKSAPPELVQRLVDWANTEIERAIEFKRATQLFNWLDANMATKDQVRFVWPVIVTLCNMEEYTADVGKRIQEFKPQRTLPSIPLEVREAAKRTSGFLTAASLLEDRVAEGKAPPVTVQFLGCKFAEPLIEGALGDITP